MVGFQKGDIDIDKHLFGDSIITLVPVLGLGSILEETFNGFRVKFAMMRSMVINECCVAKDFWRKKSE